MRMTDGSGSRFPSVGIRFRQGSCKALKRELNMEGGAGFDVVSADSGEGFLNSSLLPRLLKCPRPYFRRSVLSEVHHTSVLTLLLSALRMTS